VDTLEGCGWVLGQSSSLRVEFGDREILGKSNKSAVSHVISAEKQQASCLTDPPYYYCKLTGFASISRRPPGKIGMDGHGFRAVPVIGAACRLLRLNGRGYNFLLVTLHLGRTVVEL